MTVNGRLSLHAANILRAAIVLVGVIVGFGIDLPADQQPAPQQPTFRTEANFVRVDIFPTIGGRPVGDLRIEDFEIFEDGVLQRIESFEYIQVRPAGPQTERIEPNTVRDANTMAANPRSRVFVIFLDTYHVAVDSSHRMRRPIVQLLDQIIGPDDLAAVMTPEMSAADIAFGRRTTTIEEMLTSHWDWGERHRITPANAIEQTYERCYPDIPENMPREGLECLDTGGIAREMVDRRREKVSLDALQDLVRHLQTLREERKAIVTISEGWKLYRPNLNLARKLQCENVPGVPPLIIGRRGRDPASQTETREGRMFECDKDRIALAQLDNAPHFRLILDEANRSNASFYPIDPRGLPVFDTPIGPRRPLSAAADQAQLRDRQEALRTLASATDGLAVMGSNDFGPGLKRIAADLSSYYLLGYYSTNSKLDGKFRAIKVRVKRPGVDVRARRGYLAATVKDLTPNRVTPVPAASATTSAVTTSLAALAGIRPETQLRLHAVKAAQPSALWVIGEVDQATARLEQWRAGGRASIILTTADGESLASAQASLAAGSRTFLTSIPLPMEKARPRELVLQVRLQPSAGSGSALGDMIRLSAGEEIGSSGATIGSPLLFRRAAAGGAAPQPTADLRYRRNERLCFEAPVSAGPTKGSARLLDRNGEALAVPVDVTGFKDKDDGSRWIVGEVALAPLAAGDYLLEIEAADGERTQKILTAFRVIP